MKAQPRARKALLKKEISLGDRVQRLFTSLCAQIDGNHFTNAIKTCDKGVSFSFQHSPHLPDNLGSVLRLVPDDKDARQTKLFLLLQTERYNDALALLEPSEESSAFERTYSLYRLQQLDEAAQLLGKVKQGHEQNRGALHLEAQLVRTLSSILRSPELIVRRTTDRVTTGSPWTCTINFSTPQNRYHHSFA